MNTTELFTRSTLLEEDPESIQLVLSFVTALDSKISDIETTIKENNITALKQKTHKLKGSAALYGFEQFQKLLQEFECYVMMSQVHLYSEKFKEIKVISENIRSHILGQYAS